MLDGIVLVCVGAGILLSGPRLTGSVGCFSRFSPLAGCRAHLGVVGVSYVEMLILYEFWAWDRLVLEKAVPGCRRLRRVHFSVGCSEWCRH